MKKYLELYTYYKERILDGQLRSGDRLPSIREAAAIQGVVVVAEGAGDPLVRERLYAAVRSLLGLKAAQIAVIEGEGSDDL